MKTAMILAAGLGTRLRPLTNDCPKPLIEVGGKALIEYHLLRLAKLGFSQVVINVSYLAEKIIAFLGQGGRFGLNIQYSIEDNGPLGLMGGVRQARSLLGEEAFLLISADIWFDGELPDTLLADSERACLSLVDNPRVSGQFALAADGKLSSTGGTKDYGGFARFLPAHFDMAAESYAELISQLAENQQVDGCELGGDWFNVGTLEELELVRQVV